MVSKTQPWDGCQVCGHVDHKFEHHLTEVQPPEFVHTSAARLRQLETARSDIHPVVLEAARLVEVEAGGRKAWALWLVKILEELEEASDAPDVAAEIEEFLLGGYAN